MNYLFRSVVWVLFVTVLGGCGYTQKTKMPNDIKTLAVPTFKNVIQAKQIFSYQSGLEVRLTNAVRDRILFDGNVKLAEPSESDAVLIGNLTQYIQEPIGYDQLEQVDRYRLTIGTDLTLKDLRTNKVIWHEPYFTGEVIYVLRGNGAITEQQAADAAIRKFARDVIDRMVEDW